MTERTFDAIIIGSGIAGLRAAIEIAAGEWVALEAATTLNAAGYGLTATTLHDRQGPIGRALQALFVDRRRS